MRKLITIIIILIMVLSGCEQLSEFIYIENYDIKCVDGDTVWIDGEKIRFLAIDAPEISHEIEPFGLEAKEFACNALKNAETIDLEAEFGNEVDKYDRKLYWIYTDGELLQELLVAEGLAKVKYVNYDTVLYKNLNKIKKAQKQAQRAKKGIWSLH